MATWQPRRHRVRALRLKSRGFGVWRICSHEGKGFEQFGLRGEGSEFSEIALAKEQGSDLSTIECRGFEVFDFFAIAKTKGSEKPKRRENRAVF